MGVTLLPVGAGEESFEGFTLDEFFAGFGAPDRRPRPPTAAAGAAAPLLKLRDWPQHAGFREVLPEHFEDLMAALPLRTYTALKGARNLASYLPPTAVPPDLGPKCYCAYGELDGVGAGGAVARGTTPIHLDMSDAVNVLVYVEGAAGDAAAAEAVVSGRRVGPSDGAVWHIFSQAESRALPAAVAKLVGPSGKRPAAVQRVGAEVGSMLFDGSIYLDDELLELLAQQAGLVPFVVVQAVGDAVVVPAGCAHQVRNLRSSIKVAADFVAPEHVEQCLWLTSQIRDLPAHHHRHVDVLAVRTILFHATCACLCAVDDAKRRDERERRAAKSAAPAAAAPAVATAAAPAAAPATAPTDAAADAPADAAPDAGFSALAAEPIARAVAAAAAPAAEAALAPALITAAPPPAAAPPAEPPAAEAPIEDAPMPDAPSAEGSEI